MIGESIEAVRPGEAVATRAPTPPLRRGRRRNVTWAGLIGLAGCLGVGLAQARSDWWHEAPLGVKVHEHAFHRVTANNHQCVVRVRLYFDAPHAQYRDSEPKRNWYRFLAEIKLSGGHRFVSEPFSNSEPGPRVFAFSYDSQFDGCWAEQERKLRKVDVHACRGQGCVPHGFD